MASWQIGLALTLAALAAALALGAAAVRRNDPSDLREDRHRYDKPRELSRRNAIGRLWLLALGALSAAAAVPLAVFGPRPARAAGIWRRGDRLVTADGKPLRADTLDRGGVTTVFPQSAPGSADAAAVVVRVDDDAVMFTDERRTWVPHGNVAYSKICTHAGCPVALYRRATFELYCPCHQSVFRVLDGAAPASGPATRALPQLGLDVDAEGYLIARGDFNGPVGPSEWWST